MPYAIEEFQLPEAEQRRDKVLFKVLLFLNITFPALDSVLSLIMDKDYIQTASLPRAWTIFESCIYCLVAILQFVSGYLLIQGLNKIRTFISSR
jgi:hypothetical protein